MTSERGTYCTSCERSRFGALYSHDAFHPDAICLPCILQEYWALRGHVVEFEQRAKAAESNFATEVDALHAAEQQLAECVTDHDHMVERAVNAESDRDDLRQQLAEARDDAETLRPLVTDYEGAIAALKADLSRVRGERDEIDDAKALAFIETVPRTSHDLKDTLDGQLVLLIKRFKDKLTCGCASTALLEEIKVALDMPGTDRSYVEWAKECRVAFDRAVAPRCRPTECQSCEHAIDGQPCERINWARLDVTRCKHYRPTVCACIHEYGDSPCPVHGAEDDVLDGPIPGKKND